MRYAVVSDIHANLQAWNAVLTDIRSLKVDGIISLGDVVGYGPSPAEVFESLYANVNFFVLGNHDAALCGKISLDLFNDNARHCIEWTRHHLNQDAIRQLALFPLTLVADTFRCAHGDFADPALFNYVIEADDALPSWHKVDASLLFVGHSHQPGIFLLGPSGTPHRIEPEDFVIETGKRFLVNVGSVGQPRDGDARSSYCILDTAAASVCWRRIPFDLDAYRVTLKASGLPEASSYFLRYDPRTATQPLRKMLGFKPPVDPALGAQDVVAIGELTVLRSKVRIWRRSAVVLLALLSIFAGYAFYAWRQHAQRHLVLVEAPLPIVTLANQVLGVNLLAALPGALLPGHPVPGWEIQLGNRHRQSVAIENLPLEGNILALHSDSDTEEILLLGPRIEVQPGMKFTLSALSQKSAAFNGRIAVGLELFKRTPDDRESVEDFEMGDPRVPRKGGWEERQKTTDLPANSIALRYKIQGRFSGCVKWRGLSLVRKQ